MLSADRAAVARSVPDLRGRLGPRPAQHLSGRAERSGSVAITWHVLELPLLDEIGYGAATSSTTCCSSNRPAVSIAICRTPPDLAARYSPLVYILIGMTNILIGPANASQGDDSSRRALSVTRVFDGHRPGLRRRGAGPYVRSKTVGSVLAHLVGRRRMLRCGDRAGFAEDIRSLQRGVTDGRVRRRSDTLSNSCSNEHLPAGHFHGDARSRRISAGETGRRDARGVAGLQGRGGGGAYKRKGPLHC